MDTKNITKFSAKIRRSGTRSNGGTSSHVITIPCYLIQHQIVIPGKYYLISIEKEDKPHGTIQKQEATDSRQDNNDV